MTPIGDGERTKGIPKSCAIFGGKIGSALRWWRR
jgi:hypothetical protein